MDQNILQQNIPEKKIKMTTLFIVIGLLLLVVSIISVVLKPFFWGQTVPVYLDENGLERVYEPLGVSQIQGRWKIEQRPLYGSNRPGIYYIRTTGEWLVVEHPDPGEQAINAIYRYTSNGELVDIIQGYTEVPAIGVWLGKTGYCDWPINGSSEIRPYHRTINIDAQSQPDLFIRNQLKQSDTAYQRHNVDTGHYELFTMTNGKWQRLISSKRYHAPLGSKKGPYWLDLHRFEKRYPLIELEASTEKNNRFELVHFNVTRVTHKRFLDFGGRSRNANLGIASVKLFHPERLTTAPLHFNVPASQSRDSGEFSFDLTLFALPDNIISDTHPIDSLHRFIYSAGSLYLIQPRTPASGFTRKNSRPDLPPLNQQYSMGVQTLGSPAFGQLRSIEYFAAPPEHLSQPLGTAISPQTRRVPRVVDLYWRLAENPLKSALVKVGRTVYEFRDKDAAYFNLHFDRNQIYNAFDTLAKSPNVTLQIELRAHLEGSELKAFVADARQRIPLQIVAAPRGLIRTCDPNEKCHERFYLSLLFDYQKQLEQKKCSAGDYLDVLDAAVTNINTLQKRSQNNNTAKDHYNLFGGHIANTINALIRQNRYEASTSLIRAFPEKFYPASGLSETNIPIQPTIDFSLVQNIAADALVIASYKKDLSLLTFVQTVLLYRGHPTLTNARLLFNFACVSARLNHKQDMLEYMSRAIALKIPAEQFKTDSDFENYRRDTEFLRLLSTAVSE